MSGLEVDIEARLGAFRLQAAFSAPTPGVTALFGASGAGKSSVLAAVAGALRPSRGTIRLDGETLFDAAAGIDAPMERRGIGYVFQDARLFPHMSVRENLDYGRRRTAGRPEIVGFDEVVDVLGVGSLLERRTPQLSGGEKQRVAIGRALLSQPRLLLMDEPLAALDAPRKAEILPFLEGIRGRFGLPILYVAHAFAEVARLADRVAVMEAGKVVAQGPLAEMLGRSDLPILSARADAAASLDAHVGAHDEARGLTRLHAGAVELLVPILSRPLGAPVRALVLARDVMVATERPVGLSARNVLEARIAALDPRADGSILARLAPGGEVALFASLTRDAVDSLGLEPGRSVFAVVKSVAVEGAAGGGLLAALDD